METESVDTLDDVGSDALSDQVVHNEEMKDILENTWWLAFCGCTGFGISRYDPKGLHSGGATGGCGLPLVTAQEKFCCIHGICMTEDCYTNAGLFYMMAKVGCLFAHFGCPPGGGDDDGIPVLACCNIRSELGEKQFLPGEKDIQHANEKIAEQTFLCFYLGCFGLGLSQPCGTNEVPLPCFKMSFKTGCVLQEWINTSFQDEQGVCMYSYQKACCCISASVCPPGGGADDGVPLFACCGMNCGGEDDPAQTSRPEDQQTMIGNDG